ncbi:hypothetical protein LN050_05930 [Comamonadaceae bacterium M7527]|nr:hypothetical protein LN050_05930 [Comamonadaceae bacterium M7527]
MLFASLILCLYGLAIFFKCLSFNALQLAHFGKLLLATNLVELTLWFSISFVYYQGRRAHVGLMLLYTVMAIYASVPLAFLAFDLEIFSFDTVTIQRAMLAQSLASTHLFLFAHLLITPRLVSRVDNTIDRFLNQKRPKFSGEIVASLFGLVIALIYYKNFHSSGVADMVGSASRVVISKAVETGKTWLLQYVFFAWLMAVAAVSLFSVENRPTPWLARGIQMVAVMLFMYAYIAIGNRRELAILLIFLIVLSIFRKKKLLFAVAAVSFPVLLTLGVYRALEGSAFGELDITTNMLNLFGEFIFPHYPLLYYSEQAGLEQQLGSSYLNLPLYILPGFELWEKAQSLAQQFSLEYSNGDMGYAITPLAEGFVNFGWLSVVFVPLLLTLTFRLFFHLAHLVPFGIMTLMSFPLDISRGEFTSMALQWIIFTLTLTMIARIYTTNIFRGLR